MVGWVGAFVRVRSSEFEVSARRGARGVVGVEAVVLEV